MKKVQSAIRGIFEKVLGSGEWWIRYADAAGRIRREKAGTWTAARNLYIKRKAEVLQGRKLPEKLRQRPVTFADLAQAARADIERRHRRTRDSLTHLTRAVDWFGAREAVLLIPSEIEAKLSAVADTEGWASSTYNHHLNAISLAYRLALRAGKVSVNPARQVPRRREENVRQGFIMDAQYTKLSQACDSLWLRTMLALGYTYGWRAGELVRLHVAQVDVATRTVRLEPGTTKNRDGRTIRLTGECLELMKVCTAGKEPGDALLTYENGSPVRAYRYGWEQLCVSVGLGRFVCSTCKAQGPATVAAGRICPACSKAKRRGRYAYEGLLFHDLRRSAVRNLERARVPRSVAMKITGHKTESVYRRYAIVSEADLDEAVMRLEHSRQLTPELTPVMRQDKSELANVN